MSSYPNRAKTDANGKYHFGLNEPCETWATLTFHREGYASVDPPQLRGIRDNEPPLDVCLSSASP